MATGEALHILSTAGLTTSAGRREALDALQRGSNAATSYRWILAITDPLWRRVGGRAIPLLSQIETALGSSVRLVPRNQRVAVRDISGAIEARGEVMLMAAPLGFSSFAQTRIATVVSELARNIAMYAGSGEILLMPRYAGSERSLMIQSQDHGPGIADLDAVLGGTYRSKTGLGQGLRAVRQVADAFAIHSTPISGTQVRCTFRHQ